MDLPYGDLTNWLKVNSNEIELFVMDQWNMLYSIASGYIQNLANHLSITYQTELGESVDTYLHDYKNI